MIASRGLGRTGVTVSALGFGVSGPHATALVSPVQTARLIRLAIDLGMDVFDTAPIYGDGEAERRLGRALDGVARDRVFVTTKAGLVGRDARGAPKRDFSFYQIRHSIYWSLKRLGLGYVDAYLLHGPAAGELTDELLGALDGLKRVGACRFVGVCGRGDEVIAAAKSGVFDLAMLPVHAGLDDAGIRRLEACRAAGLGILGIETLGPSLPRFKPLRGPGDVWFNARRLIRGGGRSASLSPADALRAALAPDRADVAVITTTRAAHLEANVAAAFSAQSSPEVET